MFFAFQPPFFQYGQIWAFLFRAVEKKTALRGQRAARSSLFLLYSAVPVGAAVETGYAASVGNTSMSL